MSAYWLPVRWMAPNRPFTYREALGKIQAEHRAKSGWRPSKAKRRLMVTIGTRDAIRDTIGATRPEHARRWARRRGSGIVRRIQGGWAPNI